MKRNLLAFLFILFCYSAYSQTMGFFYKNPGAVDGYVLFSAQSSDTTYLIDKCGKKVHTWKSSYHPGASCHFQTDGSLLRCGDVGNTTFNAGGKGGILEKYDWEGNLTWSYKISDTKQCQHHDAIQLPNGNILAIVWDSYTKDEAIANGRKSSNLGNNMWSDKLVEIKPEGNNGGTIVWEWKAWDHLIQENDPTKLNYGVVKDHPELLDINLGSLSGFNSDWLHMNGLDFDSVKNQIIVSTHNLSELWIIDHSTTMEEAKGHTGGKSGKGGDFLYRWGNPLNYQRGTSDDRRIYQQHNPVWIPEGFPGAGQIMVFNNGVGQPGQDFSTIVTFSPPEMVNNNYPIEPDSAYMPKNNTWVYTANPASSFNSFVMGGSQRLYNGNTIICEANSGELFEVDSISNEVWRYIVPIGMTGKPLTQGTNPSGNSTFRCVHIDFDHPGLAGKDLIPGAPVEKSPLAYDCTNNIPTGLTAFISENQKLVAYPNPFVGNFTLQIPGRSSNMLLQVYDATGRLLHNEKVGASPLDQNISIDIAQYKGLLILTVSDLNGHNIWKATAIAQ